MEELKDIRKELYNLKIRQFCFKINSDGPIYKQLKEEIDQTKKRMAFCIMKEKEMKSDDKHKTR